MTITFTGWKNSSTTFCALESSEGEQTPEGTSKVLDCELTPELLAVADCRFRCLRWDPLGDLNILQVKKIATARPATAPMERESWYKVKHHESLPLLKAVVSSYYILKIKMRWPPNKIKVYLARNSTLNIYIYNLYNSRLVSITHAQKQNKKWYTHRDTCKTDLRSGLLPHATMNLDSAVKSKMWFKKPGFGNPKVAQKRNV